MNENMDRRGVEELIRMLVGGAFPDEDQVLVFSDDTEGGPRWVYGARTDAGAVQHGDLAGLQG